MSEATAIHDYRCAAALRRAAFELLDEHVHRGVDDRNPQVIAGLQNAANCLGAVERSLSEKVGQPSSSEKVGQPSLSGELVAAPPVLAA